MANKRGQNTELQELRNSIHTLLTNIRFSSPDKPIKSIVITSSVPNEGKTTVAAELARAIAQSGSRVLLVEADMRRRSLGTILGVHAENGVYSVITGQVPAGSAVIAVPRIPRLFFLDAEPRIPNPVEVLSSKRFAKLYESMMASFDYVIFDTPPVGTFVDAAVIAAMADATVMCARVGEVKRDDLRGAYEQLQKSGVNVIGVCATFCESLDSSYYYYYYSEDGKRTKRSKRKSQ